MSEQKDSMNIAAQLKALQAQDEEKGEGIAANEEREAAEAEEQAAFREGWASALEGTPIGIPAANDVHWPAAPTPASRFFEGEAPKVRAIFERAGGGAFIPAGKVGVVSGTGGAGKTTWLLRLAMMYAGGITADGIKPVHNDDDDGAGKVLYVCGEESEDELHGRIQRGFDALLRSHEDKPFGGNNDEEAAWLKARREEWASAIGGRLHVVSLSGIDATLVEEVRGGALTDTHRVAHVRRYAHRVGASLIIVDPLARFNAARGEVDNAAATAVVRAFEKLTYEKGKAGAGATVLVSHHVGKGKATVLSSAEDQELQRGASALTDGVRWQLNLVAGTNVSNDSGGTHERTWGLLLAGAGSKKRPSDDDCKRKVNKVYGREEGRIFARGLKPEEFTDARVVRTYVSKFNAGASGDAALYALYKGQLYPVTCFEFSRDGKESTDRLATWADVSKLSGKAKKGGKV